MTKIPKILSFEFQMNKRNKMGQKQMLVTATFVEEYFRTFM